VLGVSFMPQDTVVGYGASPIVLAMIAVENNPLHWVGKATDPKNICQASQKLVLRYLQAGQRSARNVCRFDRF
jgi:hypothetical protein